MVAQPVRDTAGRSPWTQTHCALGNSCLGGVEGLLSAGCLAANISLGKIEVK